MAIARASKGDSGPSFRGVKIGASFLFDRPSERAHSSPINGVSVMTIAALYVEPNGTYSVADDVDMWDEKRDARMYDGPYAVVAHPPCQRWGKYWHGSTRKPHQFKLGDDNGCFAAALASVRAHGGVLEHPADSHAWSAFGIRKPTRHAGWQDAGDGIGQTCYVEQGHYGHVSRKPTWLYAVKCELPELNWTKGDQRLPQWMIDRYGYEKARRCGVIGMIGGKRKTEMRNATPHAFREILLAMARSVKK